VPTHDWQTLCGATVASLRADGRWQRVFVDDQGRLLRTCKDHEDVLYRYDALGRLKSRLVHAMKAGEQWQVLSEHNGLGQEIVRTFLHNGAIRFSQRMTWRGDGRLISKANYQDGQLKSTERFVYDVLDRLKGYTCDSDDAAYCPTNASGDAVKAQAFIWDALDNIVTNVTTRFDGTQHTQDFSYDANADPTRMTSVQHGSQSRVLSWSDNGYLVDDGQGHAFSYTGTGQVSRVNDAEGQLLSRYQYDGHQRLVAQYVEQDESIRELRYDGDELIGEIWFDKTCAVTRRTSISAGLAEYEGDQVRWLIDDPQVGIAGQVRDGGLTLAPRLPFGEGALLEGVVSGYNGMRRDPVTGQYPAGNGYRSYDPGIGRYAQPDWLAPFGDSGHNPYQHCPDPVNLHDPSGAIMLSRWGRTVSAGARGAIAGDQERGAGGKWRGLALSFVLTVLGGGDGVFGGAASMMLFAFLTTMAATSFGLEVAAALTAETNPELSKALGIASMATGVLSTLGFQG
jgi:RHS repeat-associated protein